MSLLTRSALDRNDNALRSCHYALSEIRKRLVPAIDGDEHHFFQIDYAINAAASTIEANWTDRCAAATFRDLPDYGDHMTVAEWLDCVRQTALIDHDGSGSLATETQESSVDIRPSDITRFGLDIPKWATHVMWFNK